MDCLLNEYGLGSEAGAAPLDSPAKRLSRRLACAALSATLLAGCGAGTAGIFASSSSSSSGGSGNSAPTLSNLQVMEARTSPATIRFVLADNEANPATVTLFYDVGGVCEAISQVPTANPDSLATSTAGTAYDLAWEFADEALLFDDERFVDAVTVFALLPGETVADAVEGQNSAKGGVGNDPPVVESVDRIDSEVAGIVGVSLTASDSSSDVVDIAVDFDVIGDDPDAGWQTAEPALGENTLDGVQVAPGPAGTRLTFFWDTSLHPELKSSEAEVRLRFSPDDRTEAGDRFATPAFRVDNNAAPVAFLDSGVLLANMDRRRGIPVPFELFDDEGDTVDLHVQWSRPGEEFQTATEYPVSMGGRVVPLLAADRARLPELGSSAAGLLARGIVGAELEILRGSRLPAAVSASWAANPLERPVAALPLAGPEALVLDGTGGWRLSRMDLATGEILQSIQSLGKPSAMAFEPDHGAVVVASHMTGSWQLERVDLEAIPWTVTSLVSADDGSTERGSIRGLACLGSEAALITVATSLIHVSYPSAGLPAAASVLEGLQMPFGVVLDPLNANRIYLAERDAPTASGMGHIVALRLDTRALELVTEIARPTSMAVERSSNSLLVVADSSSGNPELHSVSLGDGGPQPIVIAPLATGEIGGVATGPAGLRLVALTGENDLAVGGGVQQVRTILSYDPWGQEVLVDRPFQPPLAPLARWRLFQSGTRLAVSAGGTRNSFVWDSSDLEGVGGEVFFRVEPSDSEEGLGSESALLKTVLHSFEDPYPPVALGEEGVTDGPVAGLAVDLNADGRLDLVSANREGDDLTVFFQPLGGFQTGTPPDVVLGGTNTTNAPVSVAAGDLNGDGLVDLASANSGSHNLTLFLQSGAGSFESPVIVGGPGVMRAPSSVQAADLDGDGRLDLVSANAGSNDLTVFLQAPSGTFGPTPTLVLGSAVATNQPSAVEVVDLDGDGDLDLVSANRGDAGPHALRADAPPSGGPTDVLETRPGGNNLALFFQTSPGVFDPVPVHLGDASTTYRPNAVKAADLDGDGDLDLVSANLGPPTVNTTPTDELAKGSNLTIFFQTSPGVFDPLPLVLGGFAITTDPSDVVAADLDGDGDLDLTASIQALDDTGVGGNELALFYQASPGVFPSDLPARVGGLETTGSPAAIVVADVNGDGSPDLVSFNSGELPSTTANMGHGNDLTVFFQVRAGRPDRTLTTLDVFDYPVDIEVADLDGDGDLDVLAANANQLPSETPRRTRRYTQTSPGAFVPDVDLPDTVTYPTNEVVTDLDGDGDLDVALAADGVAGRFEPGIELLFQTSPGVYAFQNALFYPPLDPGVFGALPTGLAASDLDGDGDPDLVGTNWTGARLALFFQTSPGVFDPTPVSLEHDGWYVLTDHGGLGSRGPCSVVAADLDGDGYRDLASVNQVLNIGITDQFNGNFVGGDLTIFFQTTTPGEFEEDALVLGESPTRGTTLFEAVIDAADMDGDGDLDLISPTGAGQDVTIFYQTGRREFDPTPASLPSAYAFSAQTADVDRDGDLDVVAANLSSAPLDFDPGDLTIFRQTNRGTFIAETLVVEGMGYPLKVKVADMDGDGDPDFIVGSLFGEVTVLYGGHE